MPVQLPTITTEPTPPRFPRDFAWRQSTVGDFLRCPRKGELKHVLQATPDHRAGGYGGLMGTADHAAIAYTLELANKGETPTRAQLHACVLESFDDAIAAAHEAGEHTDPDGVERAFEQLGGVRLDRIERLANDPRIRAIEWRGIEEPFAFTNRGMTATGHGWRRRWRGTADAWGVARDHVRDFGKDGRDSVDLRGGDPVLVDWKTGEATPLGYAERRGNVQLAIYRLAIERTHSELRGAPWRMFLGNVQDLSVPKRPTDAEGNAIPRLLPKTLNPAWLEATGLSYEEGLTSRNGPKGPDGKRLPKWAPEQINPAWELATTQPRGPLFRECRVAMPLALRTITHAIRAAEAGIFPASGALTGACGFCAFINDCPGELAEGEERDDR